MKKGVILGLSFLVLACARPQVVYKPQEVKIPVPVPCPKAQVPPRPALPLILPTDPPDVKAKKLIQAIGILMADDEALRLLLRAYE